MLLRLSSNEGDGGGGGGGSAPHSFSVSYSIKVSDVHSDNRAVTQTWTESLGLLTETSTWLIAALNREIYKIIESKSSGMFRPVATMIIRRKTKLMCLDHSYQSAVLNSEMYMVYVMGGRAGVVDRWWCSRLSFHPIA